VEDGANSSSFSVSNKNSIWLDATDTLLSISMNSNNFFDKQNVYRGAGNASVLNVYALPTYSINCTFPSMTVSAGDSIYVYFRVCAPMNEPFTFSSVSATFT
jgi:hypothetical protein